MDFGLLSVFVTALVAGIGLSLGFLAVAIVYTLLGD